MPRNVNAYTDTKPVLIAGYVDSNGNITPGASQSSGTSGSGGGGGGDASASNQELQITQETAVNTNLGADITTPTAMPTGGSGVRGWLSAIWTKINATLGITIAASGIASGAAVDGSNVTEGAKADTAITDATTTNTKMSFLKGLVKMIVDVWDGTTSHAIRVIGVAGGTAQPVSGSVTATVSGTATVTGDGAIITGETVETGGSGMLGWLSSIRHQLASLVAGTALKAGTAYIGKTIVPTFTSADNLVRPANATPYAALQSLNCNVVITAMSYTGLVVTLTAANAFSVGDYITVAGVNSGFTVTNIDGNWICGVGTNATTVVFTVTVQPTGTTPQTATHGTIAKLMAFNVGDANGNGIILSEIRVTLPGIAMTGAIRAYLYTQQVGVLVDQATFTVLITNYASRRDYYDLYPVAEGSGSDCTTATLRLWEVIKLDPADTHVFLRLESEAAGTPANAGIIYARLTGIQLGG